MKINDMPKLYSPFVRKEIKGAYVCINEISEGYEWVFEDESVMAIEKLHGTNVSISWDTVTGANSYYIYAGIDPNVDTTPGSHIQHTGLNSWSEAVTPALKFYKVTSSDANPPIRK